MTSPEKRADGARRPVAVFMPDVHDIGGTERATLRCIERWANDREVTIYTRRVDTPLRPDVKVVTTRLPTRPQAIGWLLFVAWSTAKATRLRRSANRPIVFSPGINLVGADVSVAHIYYRQHLAVLAADQKSGSLVRPNIFRKGPLRPDWRRIHSVVYARIVRALEGVLYRRTRFVFAVSPLERAAMEADGIEVVGVTPNGVETRDVSVSRSESPVLRLLSIGSEVDKKGLDVLVQALSDPGLRDTTSLTIVTGKKNVDWLAAIAASSNYVNVEFVTESRGLLELFAGFDVYVAASREDSFNMPALEAMAAGVPVLLSRRCGFAHWAAESALLIDPTPSSVAAALKLILAQPDMLVGLRDRGNALAAEMNWDVAADEIARYFDRLDADGVAT